jgi:hypothetical protein
LALACRYHKNAKNGTGKKEMLLYNTILNPNLKKLGKGKKKMKK